MFSNNFWTNTNSGMQGTFLWFKLETEVCMNKCYECLMGVTKRAKDSFATVRDNFNSRFALAQLHYHSKWTGANCKIQVGHKIGTWRRSQFLYYTVANRIDTDIDYSVSVLHIIITILLQIFPMHNSTIETIHCQACNLFQCIHLALLSTAGETGCRAIWWHWDLPSRVL